MIQSVIYKYINMNLGKNEEKNIYFNDNNDVFYNEFTSISAKF